MSFSTGFKKCKKCGKLLLGLFDDELCDECEKAEQKPIEKITLWGGEQFVSIETYQQVCKERDIAIEQLYELGYELGQKQEPCDDVISREDAIHAFDYLMGLNRSQIQDILFKLPPVRPQEPIPEQWQELKEAIVEMRDNDGTGTQQEVCKFLANYMGVLEKQMVESQERGE